MISSIPKQTQEHFLIFNKELKAQAMNIVLCKGYLSEIKSEAKQASKNIEEQKETIRSLDQTWTLVKDDIESISYFNNTFQDLIVKLND